MPDDPNELLERAIKTVIEVQEKSAAAYDANTEQLRTLAAEVHLLRTAIGLQGTLLEWLKNKLGDIEEKITSVVDDD